MCVCAWECNAYYIQTCVLFVCVCKHAHNATFNMQHSSMYVLQFTEASTRAQANTGRAGRLSMLHAFGQCVALLLPHIDRVPVNLWFD